jgi:hypothetical protein
MAKPIERLDYDTFELIRLTGGSLSGVGAELAKYHPYAGTPTHRFCEPFYPEPLHNCTPYRKPNVDVPTYSADKCGFLTLPTELRLMVYEQLTVRTRQDLFHKLYNFEYNGTVYRDEVKFTLVTKSVPGIALLATCKQISEEAWPILMPLLGFVTFQRPRLVLDLRDALTTVASPAGPFPALVGFYVALKEDPLLAYSELLSRTKSTDYPFHSYPWNFEDKRFCNAIMKLAHQLVYYRNCNGLPVLDIGIKDTSASLSLTRDGMPYLCALHDALWKWFGKSSVAIHVRMVQHFSRDIPGTSFMEQIGRTEWNDD